MARLMLRSGSILSSLSFPDITLGSICLRTVQGIRCTNGVVHYATNTPEEVPKKQKVSKAMKAYLQRAKEHDDFIREQLLQYNVGKRHLANMMGEDPETFTQEDIDRAIEYLFPSGLFEPKARPMMKPPEEIFPPKKAAEFDESGRPYHFLFYTGKPNYYQLLYDIVEHLYSLNDFEDKMIRKHVTPDTNQALNMLGTNWLSLEDLQLVLVETIDAREHENFKLAMDRLLQHPYSYKVKDFIDKYRKPIMSRGKTFDIPKPQYDADGRTYVTTKQCLRKASRGEVTLRFPGTGKITVNDKEGLEYFKNVQDREQLLFPLIFTNMVGTVDVEAKVEYGGPSGQAGAIRWGISWGLRSFLDEEMVEKMRLAGLLQRDYRRRERKKPGQAGARRKYTWKKR